MLICLANIGYISFNYFYTNESC